MSRLPRRRKALTFNDLILNDRHHERFLHHDLPHLTSDQVWAERRQLELQLATLIWQDDRDVILGSDILIGAPHPVTRQAWIRSRLRQLEAESQRRLEGRAA